jgi:D-alanine-D-alanine ligase
MENQFDEKYIRLVYSHEATERERDQVDFIIKNLKLKKGMEILDLGCGNGRHSIEFAKKGYEVTAVDSSSPLLEYAKRKAVKEGIDIYSRIRFLKRNMCQISFTEKFDAIISMFAFGFLEEKEEHETMLKNIHESLKQGGKFILTTPNGQTRLIKIARNAFRDAKTGHLIYKTRSKIGEKINEKSIHDFDLATMRETITSTWREENKKYMVRTSMYIFLLPEILYMMQNIGFSIEHVWGDFDGAPASSTSSVVVISAIKK